MRAKKDNAGKTYESHYKKLATGGIRTRFSCTQRIALRPLGYANTAVVTGSMTILIKYKIAKLNTRQMRDEPK